MLTLLSVLSCLFRKKKMADVPAPGCDTPPREIAVIGPRGGVYSASETHPCNKEVVSCGPEPAKKRDGCHRREERRSS